MRVVIKRCLTVLLSVLLLIDSNIAISNMPAYQYIPKSEIRIQKLTNYISDRYKVDTYIVKDVVKTAHVLGEYKKFPSPTDILAIIAIESSFNKNVLSKTLDKGLMQISYKETEFDIHNNMADGVSLLKDYHNRLSKDGTIQAYNIGIGSYKKGRRNPKYLLRFKTAKAQLEKVIKI